MCVGEGDAILADKLTTRDPSLGPSARSVFSRASLPPWKIILYFQPTFSDAGGMYE